MNPTPVMDYGESPSGELPRRTLAAIENWLKRYGYLLLVLLVAWVIVGHREACILAQRHAALLGSFFAPTALDRDPQTGNVSFYVLSSFGDDYIERYDAKIVRRRIGNGAWIPYYMDGFHGRQTHRGSNAMSEIIDSLPVAALPPGMAAGGSVQVTYELSVRVWPNPWHAYFYAGFVVQTVERTITVTVPAGLVAAGG